MPPTSPTIGTVISRSLKGEASLTLHFLSPQLGRMILIKRISKQHTSTLPDLFDSAEIVAESGKLANTYFLREYNLHSRRDALARNYNNFDYACRFATILDKNLFHAEYPDRYYALLTEALDAWEAHTMPQTIFLKALYRLAREEGYAVKEQWFAELPSPLRPLAIQALNTPTAQLNINDAELAELVVSLLHWLANHTDICVNPSPSA